MSHLSPFSNDKLHKVQKPERAIVAQYRALCAGLVDLATNSENDSTKVAAHRVIQEYIIKPLKEQYLAERLAKKNAADSTPKSVNIAVSNLPVGAAAQVQIVNTGHQEQTQHNGPSSRKEINTHQLAAISHKTNDDSPLAQLGVGGEAAEKPCAALTNVDNPPHFLDISNDLCDNRVRISHEVSECLDLLTNAERTRSEADLPKLAAAIVVRLKAAGWNVNPARDAEARRLTDTTEICSPTPTTLNGSANLATEQSILVRQNQITSASISGYRENGSGTSEKCPTTMSSSQTSREMPSSNISGEQVKTYETLTAEARGKYPARRCPDCHVLWTAKQKEEAAVGRRCLSCGVDISQRAANAVRCFRCSKARKNQQTVDWQVERKKKEVERADL